MTLRVRIERVRRQRRIARLVLRLLRLNEVEVLPVGEYSLLFGYVELWGTAGPVVEAARAVARARIKPRFLAMGLTYTDAATMERLIERLAEYDDAYPAHRR